MVVNLLFYVQVLEIILDIFGLLSYIVANLMPLLTYCLWENLKWINSWSKLILGMIAILVLLCFCSLVLILS